MIKRKGKLGGTAMFESFETGDPVLQSEAFLLDEVRFNLIHRITEYPEAIRLASADRKLIFTQSQGHNPWLWVSGELGAEQQTKLVQQLAEWVGGCEFPGISAQPELAKTFAEAFCGVKGKLYHTHMMLEVYHCLEVRKPAGVSGRMERAKEGDIPVIAEFLAGFLQDAFGERLRAEDFLAIAAEDVAAGSSYLWVVDQAPVSMAKITHRSPRHARINDVYTPSGQRKHGYASALVAELSGRLLSEGLTPLLYADGKNPDSNKVYRSIGFQHAGRIADLKFD
ncbi:GNAT family N-acetyltransferase [Paenibacillus sp. S150]|uniref:GNAT family N-acetyltransferase n=1 Tax=Paenibacillus sp. S150 TaxID=2749826 RepID=UPI001C57EB6F|nr:GNAT family N-acetyltransferase [Paenibacillus sp. S150]MBW4082915.1 GNAT family N-acetyltransferase [Paenibacillus sp. S150]